MMSNSNLQQRITKLEQNQQAQEQQLPSFVYFTGGQISERIAQELAFEQYKDINSDNELIQSFKTVDDLFEYAQANPSNAPQILNGVFVNLGNKQPHENAYKGLYDPETGIDISLLDERGLA